MLDQVEYSAICNGGGNLATPRFCSLVKKIVVELRAEFMARGLSINIGLESLSDRETIFFGVFWPPPLLMSPPCQFADYRLAFPNVVRDISGHSTLLFESALCTTRISGIVDNRGSCSRERQ